MNVFSQSLPILKVAVHILSGVAGCLLLYVGLFLTKTEENTIQNRLEEFWVRVDDLQSAALSRQAAFLQEIAVTLGRYLDRIFGRKLFSAKAMITSLWFSLFSYVLCGLFLQAHEFKPVSFIVGVALVAMLVATVATDESGCMVTLPLLPIILLLLLSVPFLLFALVMRQMELVKIFLDVFGMYGGMICSDILFVAVNRWVLRRGSDMKSAFRIALIFLLNIALGCALLFPLWISRRAEWTSPPCSFEMFFRKQCELDRMHETIVTIGASNVMTASIALFLVLLTLTALAHRLVWPILARPVLAADRHGLIEQHKLLVSIGCACLVFAWPNNVIVQALAKLLHISG